MKNKVTIVGNDPNYKKISWNDKKKLQLWYLITITTNWVAIVR